MEPGAGLTGESARFARFAVAGALAVAALSLLLPFEPVFDAWSWLIWGREVAGLDLDTSAGASWKPLPVLLTTPVSVAGDAAPALWLLIARAGWIVAVALAGRLAWRLAREAGARGRGPLVAAGIAAAALVLLGDGFTPWIRQFAGGLSEPLLVALVLGAIEAHLVRARWVAFGLLTAAALLRPEAWPFLLGYGVWLWRAGAARAPIILALAAVPLFWLGPDLIGSGSPISGAERAARADDEGPVTNGLEALWRAGTLAPAALVAALVAWLVVRRGSPPEKPDDGARTVAGLATLALAWVAIVFVMSLFGFAGLPRFSAPAGAVFCVLGAVALVLLAQRGGVLRIAVAVAVFALAVQGGFRAVGLGDAVGDAVAIHRNVEGMREVVDTLGPEPFARCGAVTTSDLDSQPALAWELERHVSEVSLRRASAPAQGIVLFGEDAADVAIRAARDAGGAPAFEDADWSAYLIACVPPATSRSGTADRVSARAGDGVRR